jgi:hypothetical protein
VQGYLSIITVAELAAGQMRQEEEATKVQHLLALFTHIDLDFVIAWRGERFAGTTRLALPMP